jgi:hypothetical protein
MPIYFINSAKSRLCTLDLKKQYPDLSKFLIPVFEKTIEFAPKEIETKYLYMIDIGSDDVSHIMNVEELVRLLNKKIVLKPGNFIEEEIYDLWDFFDAEYSLDEVREKVKPYEEMAGNMWITIYDDYLE